VRLGCRETKGAPDRDINTGLKVRFYSWEPESAFLAPAYFRRVSFDTGCVFKGVSIESAEVMLQVDELIRRSLMLT